MSTGPRLAELVGGLTLATDLVAGLPLETALRTTVRATEVGRTLGLSGASLADIYYSALLRFIGCTAFAPEAARVAGGDDQRFMRALTPADGASPASVLTHAWRGLSATAAARLVADPGAGRALARSHCELAIRLGGQLGMGDEVKGALGEMYERWDGRGEPHRLRGAAIRLPARIVHLAFRVEATVALDGTAAVAETLRARRGKELEPGLCDAVLGGPPLSRPTSIWAAFLAAEPEPVRRLDPAGVEPLAEAFAYYVDVKSPFTVGHSTAVAALCDAAAPALRLGDEERRELRIAALLHDLGRCAVPNGIWDKPGPLDPLEWERARSHATHTERILGFSPLLAPYAALASSDHERTDGSGYPRAATAGAAGRLLAACDVYCALVADRPHRPAFTPARAAEHLTAEARAGRLDRGAVEATLAAAQGKPARVRGGWPAGLSDREAEVLKLVAAGLANKEIAARLFISAKTVQHHITHIHEKTGVSTRAAAAVFAMQHGLLEK